MLHALMIVARRDAGYACSGSCHQRFSVDGEFNVMSTPFWHGLNGARHASLCLKSDGCGTFHCGSVSRYLKFPWQMRESVFSISRSRESV
jgi:hypothetical protein